MMLHVSQTHSCARSCLRKMNAMPFCMDGRSNAQPICDGSHIGSNFEPKMFRVDNSGPGIVTAASDQPPVAVTTAEEPTVTFIHQLARQGLSVIGHHGPMTSMDVPRAELPHWDALQIVVAQMARKPLREDHPLAAELGIGPRAARPLRLDIPLFVSDMSFAALSEETKLALARGAKLARTGIRGHLRCNQTMRGRRTVPPSLRDKVDRHILATAPQQNAGVISVVHSRDGLPQHCGTV